MLKSNLSTRPFYNEQLLNALLVLAAVAGLALAAFNATQLATLWSQRSAHSAKRDASKASADQIKAEAERDQQSVDRLALLSLGGATQEANSLIDERTFSWTVFFGLVEKTIPMDVRLIAVAPRDEKGSFSITMTVNAKTDEKLQAFIEALQATGSFYDLLPTGMTNIDDGTLNAVIQAGYVAPGAGKPKNGNAKGLPGDPGGRP